MKEGTTGGCPCKRYKKVPRDEVECRLLQHRLNRMIGQLGGIQRMIEENRYCGDILIQVAAVESALRSFGEVVLRQHLETCVTEEVRNGNTAIMEETMALIRKLN